MLSNMYLSRGKALNSITPMDHLVKNMESFQNDYVKWKESKKKTMRLNTKLMDDYEYTTWLDSLEDNQ